MASREPFNSILQLEIGESMLVDARSGEDIYQAFKRYKKRFSTWRQKQLSFVAEIIDGRIEVTRTEFGKNKKLWRWEAMKAGEYIVLAEDPSESEIRAARNSANYLMSVKKAGGVWTVQQDRCGRLIVRCMADKEGGAVDRIKPIKETPSEKAERLANVYRYLSDCIRFEARHAAIPLRDRMMSRAAFLDEEVRALEAGFVG
ncbi:hypothetical protein K3165_02060 [Qipengyuania sp. 1XM1-15A]|uniref:hypothetical protein n=1 Tax=Qipengyuania xiamenensis TaxID=2867237 RepID=UPI001C877D83|nr:hypothetical protein [Qipengyuania xiamenensis]MBX7531704.1 hypothetical protein [Qipengyuania xiamenensis]